MVNLSLVGSLFFSVSLDASRGRILLYLFLTAAPLAIAAPILGPALDRTRVGYRLAISTSHVVRAAAALALTTALLSVTLFPLAFLILLCRKIYALAKTGLLTEMTDDREELLTAESHIARTGTVVGGIGLAVGGLLLTLTSVELLLVVATLAYLAAALIGRKLPSPPQPVHLVTVPRLVELLPAHLWSATMAVTAVRAAAGALTFLLAFAIKRGTDEWIFAAALLTAGAGALLATLIATKLNRRLEPDGVLVLALLVPGAITAVGVLTIGNFGVLAIAFAIGLGNGVASRTVVAVQASVPSLARSRAISRSELLFQVAGLVGAALAVQLAPSPRPGFAVASLVLIAAGIAYGVRQRRSLRQQASRMFLGKHAPAVHQDLPQALLVEAWRLASLGAYRMAVVVADGAVQVAIERGQESAMGAGRQSWDELRDDIAGVKTNDEQPPSELVLQVLSAAEAAVNPDKETTEEGWYSSRSLL